MTMDSFWCLWGYVVLYKDRLFILQMAWHVCAIHFSWPNFYSGCIAVQIPELWWGFCVVSRLKVDMGAPKGNFDTRCRWKWWGGQKDNCDARLGWELGNGPAAVFAVWRSLLTQSQGGKWTEPQAQLWRMKDMPRLCVSFTTWMKKKCLTNPKGEENK